MSAAPSQSTQPWRAAAARGRDSNLPTLEIDADADQFPPGTTLGSYRVLALLREGGMGRIYVAEHVLLGRQVALKILRPQFSANPLAVARFFAEACAVNRISHENIVEITDFCENAGGHNYYIMELLKGQDLGQLLLKIGIVPIYRAVDIVAQVAGALTAVHAGRIIHRDLKPDNIFLINRPNRPGFVKLLDFGVAKLSDPDEHGIQMGTTAVGMIIGTPEYMSPEQAGGESIDHRSDIYALGVILYEMVTGALPFKAKSFGEMVVQLLTVPPKEPSTHADLPHVIPPPLEELILQLLAKDPSHRPQTMTEVETRLRVIQDEMVPIVDNQLSTRIAALRRVSDRMPFARAPAEATGHEPIMPASLASEPNTAGEVVAAPEPDATLSLPKQRSRMRLAIASAGALAAIASVTWLAIPDSGASPANRPAPVSKPPTETMPSEVSIRFRSTPEGAVVRRSGTDHILGTTPFTHRFKRSDEVLVFELELSEYMKSTQEIPVMNDGTVTVSLARLPATPTSEPVTQPATPTRMPSRNQKAHTKPRINRSATMPVFDE